MENVRLSRPARVRIERDRDKAGARVLVDGVDVSSYVTAVTWSMRAGHLPTATITFHDVEVAVDADGHDFECAQQGSLADLIPRLRKAGLIEAADFFASVKPVVARERVASMNVVRTPIPKAPAPSEKRTPEEWCAAYDVDILDPDGWRHPDAPAWTEPIALADFWSRAARSTVRNVGPKGWRGVARDAKES